MPNYNGDKTFIKSIYSKNFLKIIANQVYGNKLSGTTDTKHSLFQIKVGNWSTEFFFKVIKLYYLRKLKIMRNVIRQQSSIHDHTFTNLSELPDTICCPSGLNATELTTFLCPASDATPPPSRQTQTTPSPTCLHQKQYIAHLDWRRPEQSSCVQPATLFHRRHRPHLHQFVATPRNKYKFWNDYQITKYFGENISLGSKKIMYLLSAVQIDKILCRLYPAPNSLDQLLAVAELNHDLPHRTPENQ